MNFNRCSTTITSLDAGPFISFHWTHEQVEQPPTVDGTLPPPSAMFHLNLSRVAMSVKRDDGNDGNIVAWLPSHGGYMWIHSHIFYPQSPNLSTNPRVVTVLQMCSFGELRQGDAKNIGNHQPPWRFWIKSWQRNRHDERLGGFFKQSLIREGLFNRFNNQKVNLVEPFSFYIIYVHLPSFNLWSHPHFYARLGIEIYLYRGTKEPS